MVVEDHALKITEGDIRTQRQQYVIQTCYQHGTATYSIQILTTMARPDYVMTIDSDDDEPAQRDEDGPALDPGFSFDVTGGALTGVLDVWEASADVVKSGSKPVCRTSFLCPCRADLHQV
jgi:hypothetical protein